MNIYLINWVQFDDYGLSAVVIADSEEEALRELNLDLSFNGEVTIYLLGPCSNGTKKVMTVCRESL